MSLRFRSPLVVLVALLVAGAFLPTSGANSHGNVGTIKVHDDAATNPDQRNVPHVSCDFYIEGFGMKDDSGWLQFWSWPPTGNKTAITPGGASTLWTSDGVDANGDHHFMAGPFNLPSGHYRVEAFGDDPHAGTPGHFAKAKTFWVEPCGATVVNPPCPTGLVGFSLGTGDVRLGWTAVAGAESYVVYRATDGGDFGMVGTSVFPAFDDNSTAGGASYEYYVTAVVGTTESVGCSAIEVTAVPFFGSWTLGAIALLGAVGIFVVLRRRA